jgi:CIC family chloride channel protein
MEDAVNKFVASKNYNLPVVKDGKYLGFVSRANTLTSYRKTIHGMMQEQ